jgi:uncharacterized repeat protein (TIGR04138 family)
MVERLIIPCDLPCIECGYNLRTLSLENRCPECGVPVKKTLVAIPDGAAPELEELLSTYRRQRFEPIAASAGCTIDAVMIVYNAFRHAHAAHTTDDYSLQQVTSQEVCDAFGMHVRHYFNDEPEARELLAEWGIHRSEDVGRIIFAMVDAGWMATGPGESVEQFAGHFTLDTLFDRAG